MEFIISTVPLNTFIATLFNISLTTPSFLMTMAESCKNLCLASFSHIIYTNAQENTHYLPSKLIQMLITFNLFQNIFLSSLDFFFISFPTNFTDFFCSERLFAIHRNYIKILDHVAPVLKIQLFPFLFVTRAELILMSSKSLYKLTLSVFVLFFPSNRPCHIDHIFFLM